MPPLNTMALSLLLYVALLVSLGLSFFGLPGTWLILAAAGTYALVTDFGAPGHDLYVLIILTAFAILAEGFELAVSIMGAKKRAVSTGTLVASIIGGIAGSVIGVPLPIVGSLVGLFAGTFLGAYTYESLIKKSPETARDAAIAVLVSRAIGIFFKAGIALLMAVYVVWKTLN